MYELVLYHLIFLIAGFLFSLFPKKTYLKRLSKPILWYCSAVVIGIAFLPIAIIYQIGYSLFKLKVKPIKYLVYFLGELFYVPLWILSRVGVGIDLLGNLAGLLIQHLIAKETDTYFGRVDMTISGSIGDLEIRDKLTPFGVKLKRVINSIFNEEGEGHCINSYRSWINSK